MSEENGWVALPKPAPRTLPAGTKLESEANIWTLETEHRAAPLCYHGTHTDKDGERFENSVLLIRAVQRVQLPAGYQFLGGQATQVTTVADLGDWHDKERLKRAIEQGRCYPTEDARRIGREEFGMVFDGDPGTVVKNERIKPPVAGVMTWSGKQLDAVAELCGTARDVFTDGAHGRYETDAELRARLTGMWGAVAKPTKVLTSPIFAPSCACGATSNIKQIGVKFDSAYRAYGEFRCGDCEQSRRRSDLQAAKVEQIKGEMDRKVTPKWCEAPRGWPEGAGDDYEL
jgi:hypothetical protein